MTRKKLYWLLPCLLYCLTAGPARRVEGPDLVPTPDAIEYSLLANALATFNPPLIQIDQKLYPSRYPLGFPLTLVPFAWIFSFDETKYHWVAFIYGLLAVFLMARTCGWLLADRKAGSVAALFWAAHPQTVYSATHVMAESALTAGFFVMLELARPWMTRHSTNLPLIRALILGGVIGLLTITKAPYGIWIVMMSLLVVAARRSGSRPALTGMVIGFLLILVAEWLYRTWAFGNGSMNGYHWWHPDIYGEFLQVFNFSYLLEPWDSRLTSGNAVYYGRMLLGFSDEFYSRYMGICLIVSLAGWPLFRTRRNARVGAACILAIWGLTGVIFCSLYFYQSSRFPHLWIPLVDMVVAWAMVWGPRCGALNRGTFGRLHLPQVTRVVCPLIIVILLYGELRRSREQYHDEHLQRGMEIQAPGIQSLLRDIPASDWVFSNYEVALIHRWRSSPGRIGVIYTHPVDSWMNGHAHALATPGIESRNEADKLVYLLDRENNWNLSPEEIHKYFGKSGTAWILIFNPPWFPYTKNYLEDSVLPELKTRLELEPIHQIGDMLLYRVRPHQAAAPKDLPS